MHYKFIAEKGGNSIFMKRGAGMGVDGPFWLIPPAVNFPLFLRTLKKMSSYARASEVNFPYKKPAL